MILAATIFKLITNLHRDGFQPSLH